MYQVTVEESKTLIQEIIHKELTKMKNMKMEEILPKHNNLLVANNKQNKDIKLGGCRKVQLQCLQFLSHNMKTMKKT